MDQIADFATIGQDAGNRCYQSIHASQRSGSTSKRRNRTRMAGDEAAALEKAEKVIGVRSGEAIIHVRFAAQLDRCRKTGVPNRETVAKVGTELPPWHRAAFVERMAAAVASQHHPPASQLRGQIHRFRPK